MLMSGRHEDDRDPERRLLRQLSTAGGLDELDTDSLELLQDLVTDTIRARTPSRPPRLPQRALALDALDVLGLPAMPRLVAWLVEARTGEPFDARALTTARRDDRVAWDRDRAAGRTPGPKLAPALHHERLEPVRALVTVSTWPLAQRIVTPHSTRADHPAALLAVLNEAERLADVEPEATEGLTRLASRLAIGLPGAPRRATADSEARDRLRKVATEEYARFADEATGEREASATRAQMIKDDAALVWGRTHPGDATGRKRARGT
jgi:hypothetical protein